MTAPLYRLQPQPLIYMSGTCGMFNIDKYILNVLNIILMHFWTTHTPSTIIPLDQTSQVEEPTFAQNAFVWRQAYISHNGASALNERGPVAGSIPGTFSTDHCKNLHPL